MVALTAADARTALARSVSEAELQHSVVELLETLGYRVWHVRDSRAQQVTDLPDLIALGHGALWLIELKRESGRLTPGQARVLEALSGVTRVYALCCRPSNLERLTTLLQEAGG